MEPMKAAQKAARSALLTDAHSEHSMAATKAVRSAAQKDEQTELPTDACSEH